MKLEEYIAKRKKEDGINEFEYDRRMENTRICTNYVFEYFNNYLETLPADEKTILQDKKNEKYRNMLANKGYNKEISEWLVSMYSDYGKHMDKNLMNLITDDFFLLYNTDAEFRALSYDVYSKAIKRFPFIEGQSEMIFRYLKEAHYVRNLEYLRKHYISDDIEDWINETYKKHGVNIYNFCFDWINYFYDTPDIWPKGQKKRSEAYYSDDGSYLLGKNHSLYWDYDYKSEINLFGLNDLYRALPKKSFIRGKKQWLEAVMMYCWLEYMVGDFSYWKEYEDKVLNNLSNKRS